MLHFDNRVFNVNGYKEEFLQRVLELAFWQSGSLYCTHWVEDKDHGLILMWGEGKNSHRLPSKFNAAECVNFVQRWLDSDFAQQVTLSEWCEDLDHDGHNTRGFQVYCDSWGHVGGSVYAICGIKPAYVWHGK